MTSRGAASGEPDLARALLEAHALSDERRRAVRARALAASRRMGALARGLAFEDEPSAHLAALRDLAARAR